VAHPVKGFAKVHVMSKTIQKSNAVHAGLGRIYFPWVAVKDIASIIMNDPRYARLEEWQGPESKVTSSAPGNYEPSCLKVTYRQFNNTVFCYQAVFFRFVEETIRMSVASIHGKTVIT
jgi:hypothetical protein